MDAGAVEPPQRPIRTLADLRSVLPLPVRLVTLGEMGTPLLTLERICDTGVYAKAEWCNPTGSFKDRGAAMAMSWTVALGARSVVAASTGNNAASVAAYAARAGLPCVLFVPAGTSDAKVVQAIAAGASLLEVDGSFSDCHRLAQRFADETPDATNLTSTYASPLMTEAHKSIAYELVDDLGTAPGSVVIPLGAGPMLAGIVKGFEELARAGRIPAPPMPVGVQATGCSPIVEAFEHQRAEVLAWEPPATTVAASIADPLTGYAGHGTRTLALLRRHGGTAIAVDDAGILEAARDLGTGEGVVCEPAAAATLAALRRHGGLPRPCVLVLSGHGLKDPAALAQGAGPRAGVTTGASPADVRAALERVGEA